MISLQGPWTQIRAKTLDRVFEAASFFDSGSPDLDSISG